MDNKKMIVDTNLDIIEYSTCVEDIATKYFNDKGEYEPHIGILHAMCVFYNLCVKESKFHDTLGDTIYDVINIREVAKDPEFIREFNGAILKTNFFSLNFNNAYKQALDIVETKKNPLDKVINYITAFGTEFFNSMNSYLDTLEVNDEVVDNTLDNKEEVNTEN